MKALNERPRIVRFHVNRYELRKGAAAWPWIIHMSGQCIRARAVNVRVDLNAEYHPERRNPKLFLTGRARVMDCGDGRYALLP
jgi:hypothetical protein